MLKEERFDFILKALQAANKVSFETVASQLQVSEDTIRRDIEALSRSGLLVKVRGGAISPAVNPLSFQDREGLFSDAKQRIALKVQPLLQRAQTVFLDGGTTMLAVAASLPKAAHLRIVTNNLALVPLLSAHPHVELLLLGGTYNRLTQTTLGIHTGLEAQKYRADLYLLGSCAIDSERGVTASVHEDGEMKRVFLRAAHKTVALANQEKLGTSDFFHVCDLSSLDGLITDLPSDDPRLDPYRNHGLEIR
ncbi:DeoR/GlpR family DNA-binding transcription regulator [Hymenobacter wooponensis]|uniref:DeoR/GlpR transcriptional regulator n=1 Tax=Hymenobacter wooponensis TaxID=1525360 RepID=A0A4Z0MDT5_9BACT|nr:DeoR/GlpR family DNA-binding transcription regulator [Hymenobacter wooponensis]TGD77671.1 DeoR/GlpR transcriptional regulator [Hymenobacter wooponensis]